MHASMRKNNCKVLTSLWSDLGFDHIMEVFPDGFLDDLLHQWLGLLYGDQQGFPQVLVVL